MSLFTDPELPPPLTKEGGSLLALYDSDSSDTSTEVPQQVKRCLVLRPSTGFKGVTALCIMTILSVVLLFYARERLNAIITSNYPHYYFSDASPMSAQIEVDPIFPPVNPQRARHFDESTFAYGPQVANHNETFAPMRDMILHYIWCGNRFADFRHYVAIKSAIEAIRPKEVYFHHDHQPMTDPDGYFTWFDLLQQRFSNIVLVNISTTTCQASGYKRYILVLDILERHGGIYMPEDAIFLRIPDRFRSQPFVSGVTSCSLHFFFDGIVFGRKDEFIVPASEKAKLRMIAMCSTRNKDFLRPCASEASFRESPELQPSCVRLQKALVPKDLWSAGDRLANITKTIVYGRTDVRPQRSSLPEDRAPRIAHYLCSDDCRLSFGTYVSVLSALYVGGLDRVLLHGPTEPSGVWWHRLQSHKPNTVLYLHRNFPNSQMTHDMRQYIMRAEILAHYGGVFHDSHVIWTQPLPDQLLEYETVISPDWHAHGSWPESVNHALFIARGGARYLQKLLKVYYNNADSQAARTTILA